MDDSTITNQDPPNTLSSLEKELEAIKNQAIKEYRGKQTQSPIRTSAENVVFSKTEENKKWTMSMKIHKCVLSWKCRD